MCQVIPERPEWASPGLPVRAAPPDTPGILGILAQPGQVRVMAMMVSAFLCGEGNQWPRWQVPGTKGR